MNWYKRQLKIAMPGSVGVRKKWELSELDRIKKLIEKGYNFNQIASLLDVSTGTIRNLNKKYNWKDLEVEKKKKDKMIANLYLLPPNGKGLSARQIEQKYNITYARIKKALERLNLVDQLRGKSESSSLIYQNNPELKDMASRQMKSYWQNNPELKDVMSLKQKNYWQNNPELKDVASQRMKNYWQNYPGGFDAWIQRFPEEKQKQIMNAIQKRNSILQPV